MSTDQAKSLALLGLVTILGTPLLLLREPSRGVQSELAPGSGGIPEGSQEDTPLASADGPPPARAEVEGPLSSEGQLEGPVWSGLMLRPADTPGDEQAEVLAWATDGATEAMVSPAAAWSRSVLGGSGREEEQIYDEAGRAQQGLFSFEQTTQGGWRLG